LAQLRVTFTPNHPDVKAASITDQSLGILLSKQRADVLTRIRNEYQAPVEKRRYWRPPTTAKPPGLAAGHEIGALQSPQA